MFYKVLLDTLLSMLEPKCRYLNFAVWGNEVMPYEVWGGILLLSYGSFSSLFCDEMAGSVIRAFLSDTLSLQSVRYEVMEYLSYGGCELVKQCAPNNIL